MTSVIRKVASQWGCTQAHILSFPAPACLGAGKVSHEGGAGESGFCYEAGASVEVAPEDALGIGGWGHTEKHRSAACETQRSARR